MVQDMVGAGHNMDMNMNAVPGLAGSAITRTNTATLNTGKEPSVFSHFKPFESYVLISVETNNYFGTNQISNIICQNKI